MLPTTDNNTLNDQSPIKIFLIVLLLICLFKWQYDVHILIRCMLLLGFGYLSYLSKQHHKELAAVVFVLLAIVFQPVFKVPLNRQVWMCLDVIVAAGLLASFSPLKKV